MSGEGLREIEIDEARQDGWTIDEVDGEKIYRVSVVLDSANLPFLTSLGDAYLSVSKAGLIDLGISVGDADAGAEGQLQWPTDAGGALIKLEAPLTLKVSGGDHASGAWSLNAKTSIQVK